MQPILAAFTSQRRCCNTTPMNETYNDITSRGTRQASVLGEMEAAFSSPAALRLKHRVMVAYDGLPAPDIYAKEEVALLGRILTRAARYDEKYARQEVALLGLLHPFLSSGRKVGVLEIGAGNANLACLVHLIYGTVHEQLQP
jgi:hypothetical protein